MERAQGGLAGCRAPCSSLNTCRQALAGAQSKQARKSQRTLAAAHLPQLPTMQPTAARSPTLNLPTEEPICRVQQAAQVRLWYRHFGLRSACFSFGGIPMTGARRFMSRPARVHAPKVPKPLALTMAHLCDDAHDLVACGMMRSICVEFSQRSRPGSAVSTRVHGWQGRQPGKHVCSGRLALWRAVEQCGIQLVLVQHHMLSILNKF